MKKSIIAAGLLLLAGSTMAQAIRDRNIVPVAVNLNQVLRLTLTDGGNIEFVFNSIDDYKLGISADNALSAPADPEAAAAPNNPTTSSAMYVTKFSVASSTRWKLDFGSEQTNLEGTDDPSRSLALNNVGFTLVNQGTHNFNTSTPGTDPLSSPGTGLDGAAGTASDVCALPLFSPGVTALLIQDNDDAVSANAGDATENSFEIHWRVGTTETQAGGGAAAQYGVMNAVSLLNQGNITPDRYVTNVLFELSTDF